MILKIVYFGTPDFSADFLKMLIEDTALPISIAGVITQPDKPVGRNKVLTPSPVKSLAEIFGIPVFHDQNASCMKNADLGLVFAYGDIITPDMLRLPKYGFWNIHPSLLPKYRGASPISYPLVLGDNQTGTTLMKMDEKLDHGPIIAQIKVEISKKDTRSSLVSTLNGISYMLLKSSLQQLTNNSGLHYVEQDHKKATFTRILTRNDGCIENTLIQKALTGGNILEKDVPDLIKNYHLKNKLSYAEFLSMSAQEMLWNMYRGLEGWPAVWTYISIKGVQKRLKVTDVSFEHDIFQINTVQIEGKKEIPFSEFRKYYLP